MKKKSVWKLLALLVPVMQVMVGCSSEIAPENGDPGWTVKEMDGDKLVWYSFQGDKFDSQQSVNVLSLDLDSKEYELDFVVLDEGDSLSSVALQHQAVAGLNAAYEWDASFIKADGKVYSEITIPSDHLRYWKHEGAISYNGRTVKIGYGDKSSYLNNPMSDLFSSSPMLIDDYKPVGETFVGDVSNLKLEDLGYEDYRRHQGVRHPRTAVALTNSNKLLLITIDGRSTHAAGMSAKEVTEFLTEYFNPRYALNMDGGGSTTLYIKDSGVSQTDVVNYPTDNGRFDHYGQRRVGTHILVKKK